MIFHAYSSKSFCPKGRKGTNSLSKRLPAAFSGRIPRRLFSFGEKTGQSGRYACALFIRSPVHMVNLKNRIAGTPFCEYNGVRLFCYWGSPLIKTLPSRFAGGKTLLRARIRAVSEAAPKPCLWGSSEKNASRTIAQSSELIKKRKTGHDRGERPVESSLPAKKST